MSELTPRQRTILKPEAEATAFPSDDMIVLAALTWEGGMSVELTKADAVQMAFRWYGRLLRDGSFFTVHYWPYLNDQNKPGGQQR